MELFAELYPSVPIIVTLREVGYDQAPLDEERFENFLSCPIFTGPKLKTMSRSGSPQVLTSPQLSRKRRQHHFFPKAE